MIRLLVIAAIIYLAIRLLRSLLNKPKQPGADEPEAQNESMIACTQCRLHVPASEAISEDGRYFCCHKHRQDWLQQNGTG